MTRFLLSAFLLVLALLTSMVGMAQRIGGVPIPEFNPSDSGAPYHGAIFQGKAAFWPGQNGGIFMAFLPEYWNNTFSINQVYQKHVLADIAPSGAIDTTTKALQRGFVRGFIKDPNGRPVMIGTSVLVQNTDTITLTKSYVRMPGTSDPRSTWRGGKIALKNAATGKFKAGLVRAGAAGHYVFWITHSTLDTLDPHNETVLILMDTTNFTELNRLALGGILVDGASYNPVTGMPLFLAASPTGTRVNFSLNGTLQYFAAASLSIALTQSPGLVQFRPDGKLLVGGRFSTFTGVKLFESTGQEDATFPTTVLNAGNSQWAFSYDNGVVRAATYDSTVAGWGKSIGLHVMAANGGWASTRTVAIDSTYRAGTPLFYIPQTGAWFCETGVLPVGQVNGYERPRYRFVVYADGREKPFGKPQGVTGENFSSYNDIKEDTDPAPGNQLLVQGGGLLLNGRLSPAFTVINMNGDFDPAFRSSMDFPSNLTLSITGIGYSSPLQYVPWRRAMLATQNRLFFATLMVTSGHDTSHLAFPDTVYRYTFAGVPAPTQKLIRATNPYPLKGGGYAALTFTHDDGRHRGPQQFYATGWNNQLADNVFVLKLDAAGELVDTIGKLRFSSLPDSLNNLGRMFYISTEDNEGGLWISCVLNSSLGADTLGQRSWLQRFKAGEPTVRFAIDSNRVVNHVSRIEVMPGRQFRIFGSISKVTQVNPRPPVYQVMLVDSVGHILSDPEFATHRPYLIPDAYTERGSQLYASLGASMPDGRFLVSNYATVDNRVTYLMFLRDGRLDPSFMPISGRFNFSLAPIQNRLYARTYYTYSSLLANRYEGRNPGFLAGMHKNNLYAFHLNAGAGKRGFARGMVERVPSPQAQGCTPTGPRHPVGGMVVTAGQTIALTDTGGYYAIALDSGSHTLRQDIGNDFLQRQICPSASAGHSVEISRPGQTVLGKNFINESYDCPRLTLYFGPNRTRLCSRGTTSVYYKNEGTATAPDARLRVFLPSLMTLRGASRPYSREADSSFTFPLGDIAAGQEGSFTIYDSVGCVAPDTNLRICYTARIEPMAVCGAIATAQINWDGSWLDAKASYENVAGGRVRHRIVNRGQDMTDSVPVRLNSQDYYPVFVGKLKLRAGDSLVLYARAGETFFSQLTVVQPKDCPLGTMGTVAFSGTGRTPTYLSLQNGWLGRQTVSQCLPVRFAFDPNEKTVYPEKQAEPGEVLHYTIHFENLGNDTAFSVLVLDTLPAELDVRGFAFEGSSHPCVTTLEGTEGQAVLSFNFNPIGLTAKRQDSTASKGYVKFALPVRKTVPRGTWVLNRGNIYFDRNPAVVTDYSRLQVRPENAPTGTAKLFAHPAISIAPNPSAGRFRVLVPEGYAGSLLTVTDLAGRLVARTRFTAGTPVEVTGLAPGVYTVSVPGLKAGRLVIHPNSGKQ